MSRIRGLGALSLLTIQAARCLVLHQVCPRQVPSLRQAVRLREAGLAQHHLLANTALLRKATLPAVTALNLRLDNTELLRWVSTAHLLRKPMHLVVTVLSLRLDNTVRLRLPDNTVHLLPDNTAPLRLPDNTVHLLPVSTALRLPAA
jgi:hypothetical protein